ncbi:MAG: transcriptional repressor [Deltaproteobacteria bacterium]|nr:transcriptional repressor [Deltaproteobacteria bacterium]
MNATGMPDLDELKRLLRDHVQRNGLKSSSRRELVLEVFTRMGRHVTADELLRAARDSDARIGAATIYRTLRVLQDSGLVVERHFEGGASQFELVDGDHHDHLICIECKVIVEFDDDVVEQAQERLAARFGFELHSHRHELYGLCPACQKKRAAKAKRRTAD